MYSVWFVFLFIVCFLFFTQDIRLKRSEERERPCSESVCTGTAPFAHRWDSNGNSNKTWHIWTLVAFTSLQLHWGQMARTHPGSVLLLWWGKKKTTKKKQRERKRDQLHSVFQMKYYHSWGWELKWHQFPSLRVFELIVFHDRLKKKCVLQFIQMLYAQKLVEMRMAKYMCDVTIL